MGEFVRVEAAPGAAGQQIAMIRLDRPPMNALSTAVQAEIAAAAAQVSADPEVRAVVVYGGEKVFAAGADIKEMSGLSYADMADRSRALQDSFTAVARIGKPVIAAITGYALGGGLELALCADFRVAGEGARVGQPEILLGLIPGAGGTQRLPRLIGPARAKDIDLHRPVRRARPRPWPSAWSTRSSPTPRWRRPPSRSPSASRPARRWRCGRPSWPSTRGWRPTSTPGWRSSGCTSRACSPPRTPRPGMRSFVENGPGKARFAGR